MAELLGGAGMPRLAVGQAQDAAQARRASPARCRSRIGGRGAVPGGGRADRRRSDAAADPDLLARRRRAVHHAADRASRTIPRPARATAACTACSCSTSARPRCTGRRTRPACATSRSTRSAGRRVPVAVVLGGDPALTYAATAPLPDGVDELLLAGFLRRRAVELVPCKTQPTRGPGRRRLRARGLRRSDRDR